MSAISSGARESSLDSLHCTMMRSKSMRRCTSLHSLSARAPESDTLAVSAMENASGSSSVTARTFVRIVSCRYAREKAAAPVPDGAQPFENSTLRLSATKESCVVTLSSATASSEAKKTPGEKLVTTSETVSIRASACRYSEKTRICEGVGNGRAQCSKLYIKRQEKGDVFLAKFIAVARRHFILGTNAIHKTRTKQTRILSREGRCVEMGELPIRHYSSQAR